MRYFIKLALYFLARFRYVILGGVILGLLVFFVIGKIVPNIYNFQSEKIGVTGRFTPEELPENILYLVSRGLTRISDDGNVEADLADWETPDGGKTWIFKLKEDVFWQDNKKFTTADINYEFSDVEISKESANTIIFKLKSPFSPFPSAVTKPLFKKGLLGLGQWRVKRLKLNAGFVHELHLENNTKNKISYFFYPTEEATKVAFKLGKVDVIDNILTPEPFNKWSTVSTQSLVDTGQIVTLFFNTQDKLLSDKSLRQALVYAVDKNTLGSRALSSIPIQSWAYNPGVKEYAYDVKHSKEILKEIPEDVLKGAKLEFITTPTLLSKADLIAKSWNDLGIKTNVHVSSVIPTDFQVYMTILDLPKDPDQYPLWHSTQTTTNISKYANPRIDKLLEDGRVELNPNERKRIYLDFQRFLLEDIPAAFLYSPTYYRITRL